MEEWQMTLNNEMQMYMKLIELSDGVIKILKEQVEQRKDLTISQIKCLEEVFDMLEFALKGKEMAGSRDSLSSNQKVLFRYYKTFKTYLKERKIWMEDIDFFIQKIEELIENLMYKKDINKNMLLYWQGVFEKIKEFSDNFESVSEQS